MTDLDQIRALWLTLDDLSQQIKPTATGHIKTTINVLLDHILTKENSLQPKELTLLALQFPDRWHRQWTGPGR